MREFKITNSRGETLMLNSPEDGYIYTPSGMGFSLLYDVIMTNTNIIKGSRRISRPVVSGSLVFDTYEKYDAFVTHVQADGLTLGYRESENLPWRYLDVDCVVQLSEINRIDRLVCAVTFNGLSRWYLDSYSPEYTIEHDEDGLPLFVFDLGFFSLGSPMVIKFKSSNTTGLPVWQLVNAETGEVMQNGKYLEGITGDYVIDSRPEHTIITINGSTNYNKLDIRTHRFIVGTGVNSKLVIKDFNGSTALSLSNLSVEVFPYV